VFPYPQTEIDSDREVPVLNSPIVVKTRQVDLSSFNAVERHYSKEPDMKPPHSGPRSAFDIALIPSLWEMQDTTSEELYSGPLADFEESVAALINECVAANQKHDLMLSLSGKTPLLLTGTPDIIIHLAAWLGSATGVSLLYRLLKTWSGLSKGRKIAAPAMDRLHPQRVRG
jgi:hypothetical protein